MTLYRLPNNLQVSFDLEDNETFIGSLPYDEEMDDIVIARGDRRIIKAARVSNLVDGPILKSWNTDRNLLRYLWKNEHWSPFEQVHLTFTVIADLRTAMQMDTYRTWHKNRYSRRYSHDWVEFIKPAWRMQNKTGNKQGGDTPADVDHYMMWNEMWRDATETAMYRYKKAMAEGMAREQAAYFLPTGVLTSTFYTVDLRNLVNFIYQRCESHAQAEIRQIAYVFKNDIIPQVCPWVAELIDETFIQKGWGLSYE